MATAFIGEIKLVPYSFAPRGYAFCAGQLLSIAQNTALFSLIGTTYGGDGVTTFALPDLRGRAALHVGTGQATYSIGENAGAESVTLTVSQLPVHAHDPVVAGAGGNDVSSPSGARLASGGRALYASSSGAGSLMPLAAAGGGGAHNNMAPYLVLNFIIALQGIFPSRN